MSAKRKQKLRERAARFRELRQRHTSPEFVSVSVINLHREVEHMRRCAADHDARCVTLGAFVFFSTETGDAWMLDPADGLALCLSRNGEAQPVQIFEKDHSIAVDWDRTYSMEGDLFMTTDRQTGRVTTVFGYPTQAILAAIESAERMQP